jgi:hypothetical protein
MLLHLFLLLTLGVAVVFIWGGAVDHIRFGDAQGYLLTAILFFPILYFSLRMLEYVFRLHASMFCRDNPDRMRECIQNLNSADRAVVRQALQTLADVWGHPFGIVECWPIDRMGDERIATVADLYRRWIHAGQMKDGTGTTEALIDGLKESAKFEPPTALKTTEDLLAGFEAPHELPAELLVQMQLPPLSPQRFLRSMRGKVDGVLRKMAADINAAPTGQDVPNAAKAVSTQFMELCWEALRVGVQMRILALTNPTTPFPTSTGSPSDVSRFAQLHLNELLVRLARMYGERDARSVFPDNLLEVRCLLADFWWAGMEVGARLQGGAQAIPKREPFWPIDTVGEKIASTSDKLAASISRTVQGLAEKVKDAILDLEIGAEEGRDAVAPELPPLNKEQFLADARTRIDAVLGELIDVINEVQTAPEIEASAEDVYQLFGELGSLLLELAIRMRVQTAVAGVQPIDVRPRRVRCKRVSEIRLPRNPDYQGGWVEKYRLMKAREGSAETEE